MFTKPIIHFVFFIYNSKHLCQLPSPPLCTTASDVSMFDQQVVVDQGGCCTKVGGGGGLTRWKKTDNTTAKIPHGRVCCYIRQIVS